MIRYVFVKNGIVENVTLQSEQFPLSPPWYPSDIAQIGWIYHEGQFYEPEQATSRVIPATEFLLRFTLQEAVQIRASTDPGVQEWMRRADDPRQLTIDLDDPRVAAGLNYLVANGLLIESRPAEILA